MSATLFLLVPVGTIAIVWLLCFVGCSFQPGQVADYYQYENTVTGTNGLVAFWPLNETSGTTAADIGPNHFNGTYTTGPNVTSYDAADQSDAAPGTFSLNGLNIVAGDTSGNNPNNLTPCTYFYGGYVEVPWQAALGPPQPQPTPPPLQFTIEAWVMPDWDDPQNKSFRVVVASNAPSAFQGFALYASPDNLWAATIGVGSQNPVVTTGNNQTIVQRSLYFLVVTYDGGTGLLTLWVNPADTTQPPDGQITATGFVPVASPTPLYIGCGHPSQTPPLFPFTGWIQDVAFYNVALDNKTIETHYANGSGFQES